MLSSVTAKLFPKTPMMRLLFTAALGRSSSAEPKGWAVAGQQLGLTDLQGRGCHDWPGLKHVDVTG